MRQTINKLPAVPNGPKTLTFMAGCLDENIQNCLSLTSHILSCLEGPSAENSDEPIAPDQCLLGTLDRGVRNVSELLHKLRTLENLVCADTAVHPSDAPTYAQGTTVRH